MKKLVFTLIVALFTIATILKAESKMRTYSHLPLELKESLKQGLSNPMQQITSEMSGNILIEFYVNNNHEIEVTALSSNNISLGYFVADILTQLPKVSKNCPVNKPYKVKVILSYR